MNRVLVIADDLSGAAEIASLGARYGLRARIDRDAPAEIEPGLTVIDTDTRLCAPDEVAGALRRATRNLRIGEFDLVYKKTDSVMRGPVLAEIDALRQIFNCAAALLVAQNPSRGRTILDGIYQIDRVPLTSTPFAHDPEYPARTSKAVELLGQSADHPVRCAAPGESFSPTGITIGAASSVDEVRQWALSITTQVLPAGGADFFQMLLETHGHVATPPHAVTFLPGITLFVCGSASAASDELIARARREQLPVCSMPDLPSGATLTAAWQQSAIAALGASGRALIVIGRPLDRSPDAAQRLQTELAAVVSRVLKTHRVDNLLLEGGATASAVCRAMGWNRFEVAGELAPGVTQLRSKDGHGQRLIVKPGSYVWPEAVFCRAQR